MVKNGLQANVDKLKKGEIKTIAFISCYNQHERDQPLMDLRSYFYGIYFDNNKWIGYDVFSGKQPTIKELKSASTIIIPGSNFSVYERRPQVVTLTNTLRSLIN